MTKFLAVALVAVCALTASLYATAAPTRQGPTNVQLAAQIASLRTQVRILKADVSSLSGTVRSLYNCTDTQLGTLWQSEQTVFGFVALLYGDNHPLRPEMVAAAAPKLRTPQCL